MEHKDKVKIANKMLTKEEKKKGVPKFQSKAWTERKEAIRKRVNKN